MRSTTKLFTVFFILLSISLSAQKKYSDALAILKDINLLLENNGSDVQRYNSLALDNKGNFIIFNSHKKSNNTSKLSIEVSKLSLEKLKVVKYKKKIGFHQGKRPQVLITSNKGKAIWDSFFKKFQKEYRLSVASKEDGEEVVKLLKMLLDRYDPS